jgi:hypothetical protein
MVNRRRTRKRPLLALIGEAVVICQSQSYPQPTGGNGRKAGITEHRMNARDAQEADILA